jgi:hypothetical protein
MNPPLSKLTAQEGLNSSREYRKADLLLQAKGYECQIEAITPHDPPLLV